VAEIKQVLVPDIGDFKDVNIIEVMVKAGDKINAEDNLVTLETDKAAMDVPSPYAGVIKEMKVKVGDKVSQGSVILVMECADSSAPSQGVAQPPLKSADESAHSKQQPAVAAKATSALVAQTPNPPIPPLSGGSKSGEEWTSPLIRGD